jgi:tetratricopeptide (TPR) repeat protein
MSLDDPRTSVKERRSHQSSCEHFPPRQSNIRRKIARPPREKSLSRLPLLFLALLFVLPAPSVAQETHNHAAPEKLGVVSFPISCQPEVQQQFDRGVALLHSFAYADARNSFQAVAAQDERCAIAHWGIAMTYFRQLWDPPILPETVPIAQKEIERAQQLGTSSERERSFIKALAQLYQNAGSVPYTTRALNYERAMSALVSQSSADVEAKVFYALALLANASPTDKTHSKQKQAASLLEPLYRSHPQHPGIPHYLIHAYDNAELAPKGLQAAKAYAQIAPSAPHALHMPSHIFTRLGLWDDSIASNLAAAKAAREQSDTGEDLHAMDYLVYAYLQSGRDSEAVQVVQQLQSMSGLDAADFKIGYAYTVMPIRLAVERSDWAGAAKIASPDGVPPHVAAIAIWARGMGLSRTGRVADAQTEVDRLRQIETQLRASGNQSNNQSTIQSNNDYWATQVHILLREVMAWSAEASGKHDEAVSLLREAADQEDGIEKLPVTPGPILPAREQLGYLLLQQNHPELAAAEFQTALANAPGRRGALQGAARAAERARDK